MTADMKAKAQWVREFEEEDHFRLCWNEGRKRGNIYVYKFI